MSGTAAPEEDQLFTTLAIRDTANNNSAESMSGIFQAKTIFIENGLNQAVTFQLQGSRNSVWVDVGATFNINATTNGFQTVDTYFPKFRVQASCSTAPTTGTLDVWLIKV